MESTDSSSASQATQPNLPPGFRFHPTDEELVVHYLKRKANSVPLPVTIIAEIDLYKFDPWELPSKASFGEQEWYFFSPRERKYPNGARPNRAATSGYWKATGTDKPIMTSNGTHKVGVKKALVFYGGKPPRGIKTNWIMHEYRLVEPTHNSIHNNNSSSSSPSSKLPHHNSSSNKKPSLRLDDWVLCRIYKKNNSQAVRMMMESDKEDSNMEAYHNNNNNCNNNNNSNNNHMLGNSNMADHHEMINNFSKLPIKRPANYGALLENDDSFLDGILSSGNSDDLHHQQQGGLKRQQLSAFWNDEASAPGVGSTGGKRFHGDLNGRSDDSTGINDTSFVSMLSHIPQSTPDNATSFHTNSVLLGSSQFQLPSNSGMNWDS